MFEQRSQYGTTDVQENVASYLNNAWSIDNNTALVPPGELTAELTGQDGAEPPAFEKTSTQALHQAAINLVLLLMSDSKINENTGNSEYFTYLYKIHEQLMPESEIHGEKRDPQYLMKLYELQKQGYDICDFAKCIGDSIKIAGVSDLDLSSLNLKPTIANLLIIFCEFLKVSSFTTLTLQLDRNSLFPPDSWKKFCDAIKISSITGLKLKLKLSAARYDELTQILCDNIPKRLKEIAKTASKAEIQELTKCYFVNHKDEHQASIGLAKFIVDTDFPDESFGVDNLGLSQGKCDEIKAITCEIIREELAQLYQPNSNNREAILNHDNIRKLFQKFIANHPSQDRDQAAREFVLRVIGYEIPNPFFFDTAAKPSHLKKTLKNCIQSFTDGLPSYIILHNNPNPSKLIRYTSQEAYQVIPNAHWLSNVNELTTPQVEAKIALHESLIHFNSLETIPDFLAPVKSIAKCVGEMLKELGITNLNLSDLDLYQLNSKQYIFLSKICKAASFENEGFKMGLSNNELWLLGTEEWRILFTIIEHLILNNNSLWKLNDVWWNDLCTFITAEDLESVESDVSQKINQIPQLVNNYIQTNPENRAQALKNLLLLGIESKISKEALKDVHLQQLYHFRRTDKLNACDFTACLVQALQNSDFALQVGNIEKLDLNAMDIFFDTTLNDDRLSVVCEIIKILRPKVVNLSGNCLYNLNVSQPTMLVDAMTTAGVETLIAKDNVFSECSDDGWSAFCKTIAPSGLNHCVLSSNHFWNFRPAKWEALFDLLKSENTTVDCVDEQDMISYELWLEERAKAYIKEHGEQAVIDLGLLASGSVVSSQEAQDSPDFQMLLKLSQEKAFAGLNISGYITEAINGSKVSTPKLNNEVLQPSDSISSHNRGSYPDFFEKGDGLTGSTPNKDGAPDIPATTSTHTYE